MKLLVSIPSREIFLHKNKNATDFRDYTDFKIFIIRVIREIRGVFIFLGFQNRLEGLSFFRIFDCLVDLIERIEFQQTIEGESPLLV